MRGCLTTLTKTILLSALLFFSQALFAVDTTVAGAEKFKLNFGAGLQFNNKDGYKDYPQSGFMFDFTLPLTESIQLGLEGKINNILEPYDKSDPTITKLNYWSALNNYGKAALGIVVIPSKVKIGLYAMAGTENFALKEYKEQPDGSTVVHMKGNAFIEVKAGMFLMEGLFNNKVESIDIKQGFKILFNGFGYAGNIDNFLFLDKANDGDATTDNDTAFSGDKALARYNGWEYFGELGFTLPVSTLSGIKGGESLKAGATLDYKLSGKAYSEVEMGGLRLFVELPVRTNSELSFDNWLKIAPDASTAFKLSIKPGFAYETLTYKFDRANSTTINREELTIFSEFALWGMKSFELASSWGIVPYIELDARFRMEFWQLLEDNEIRSQGHYGFSAGIFSVDTGVKLGLKLGNWATSIKWNPTASYDIQSAPASAAAASNIWNLANWEFALACEFPPPKR